MNKNNEYLEFKNYLNTIDKNNKPSLLLHSCCGPCSSYVLTMLNEYFKITIYYYNPNIYPNSEFDKRLQVQKEIIDKLGYDIDIIIGDYDYSIYLKTINDTSELGEGSIRCYNCYEFRLKETSDLASKLGYDYYTTTLSISPYKNSNWINELGKKYQKSAQFLYSNFKKEEGYKKSIILSKQYNLYRQDYCGCEFSKEEYNKRHNK